MCDEKSLPTSVVCIKKNSVSGSGYRLAGVFSAPARGARETAPAVLPQSVRSRELCQARRPRLSDPGRPPPPPRQLVLRVVTRTIEGYGLIETRPRIRVVKA